MTKVKFIINWGEERKMNNMFKTYMGLPKAVYVLCSATLINRLGDFVVPFLTLFLTVKLNMSIVLSGIIVTCASLISIPSSIIGGKISDSIGRKKVYLFGQGLSAVFLILCGLCKNEHLIIIMLFLSTFFNGIVRPAFSAMLIDYLPRERRQEGMSLNYLCINIGVSIGPIIAGFLFNKFLPLLFIGDGITSLISVILVWRNIEEKYSEEVNEDFTNININEAKEEGNIIQVLLKRPQLLMFFALLLIYQFVYSQHRFTLPLTVNNALNNNGAKIFGYMMSINAVTVVFLTVFITAALKKYHHLICMVLSGIAFAIGFGMLSFTHTMAGFFISTFIWTLGEILNSISIGVFVADNSPVNYRARISAFQNIIYWVASSLSTGLGGILVDRCGLNYIWLGIFIISLIASGLMYLLKVYCVNGDSHLSENVIKNTAN